MQIIRNYINRIELSNDDNQVFSLNMHPTDRQNLRVGQKYLMVTTMDQELKFFQVDGPLPNDVRELTEFYEDTYGRQMGFTGTVEYIAVTESDRDSHRVVDGETRLVH
ncbi:hypothetical protein [Erwinia phage vB_Ea277G]|nr:hypothetical protein [Erwinia phage vB_Ea277G]